MNRGAILRFSILQIQDSTTRPIDELAPLVVVRVLFGEFDFPDLVQQAWIHMLGPADNGDTVAALAPAKVHDSPAFNIHDDV